MKRYFLVFYNWVGDESDYGSGCRAFVTDRSYLNSQKLHSDIIGSREYIKDCAVSNIIEFSENDYNDWIKEGK